MRHGVYAGSIEDLRGEEALIILTTTSFVSVQFDNTALELDGKKLGYGWTLFDVNDFKLDEQEISF